MLCALNKIDNLSLGGKSTNSSMTKKRKKVLGKSETLKMQSQEINIIAKKQVNKLIAFYEKELGAIGLLENGKQVSDYYWHGVSHMLGLETHDVSLSDYKVVAGNVYTVEPGLYLEDEKIGIRIEDDILITEDGCEVLSKDIIKSIEDIEKYMAK